MSWKLKHVLPVHVFHLYAISGTDIFVDGHDFAIRQWSLATLQMVQVLSGHRGAITALHYCEEHKTLFSTSVDGRLLFWSGGRCVANYLNRERRGDCFGSPLFSVCFYSRKSCLFVGAQYEILVFKISWETMGKSTVIESVCPEMRLKLHSDVIHRLLIAGDKLISAARDRTLGFSRLDQLNVNKVISLRQRAAISTVVYDSLNERLWVGAVDGTITTVTPDGLILQNEAVGDHSAVVSIELDHTVGLVWTVFASGVLKLLDRSLVWRIIIDLVAISIG
jgi:WD40 repeat protein